jgi:hypothetical protein
VPQTTPPTFSALAAQARDLLVARARAHLADVPVQPALMADLRRPAERYAIIGPALSAVAVVMDGRDDTGVAQALGQFSDFYLHSGARLDTYAPALDAFVAQYARLGAPVLSSLQDGVRALCAAHWAELMRQADAYIDRVDADGAHHAPVPTGLTAQTLCGLLDSGYPAA